MHTDTYAISGGKEGKGRLDILSSVLEPYTRTLLMNEGITEAKSFLDVGCGGGNVCALVSHLTEKNCSATGIDFDSDILKLAERDATERDITNIQYLAMNVYDMEMEDEYEVVYARFLLSHLEQPLPALQKMKQAATPGGKIIVEDIQFSRHFCFPFCESFYRYVQLYPQAVKSKGGNAELGADLPALFTEAGLEILSVDVIQPVFKNGNGKKMAYETMDKIKNTLLDKKLAEQDEVVSILSKLKSFTEDRNSFLSLPAIYRVTGVKK